MDSQSPSEFTGTITRLVRRLPERNADVTQALFEFLMARLERQARTRLANAKKRVRDEEDLLGEVIGEFLIAGEKGALPAIQSREDVLKMLSRRLQQRAANFHRHENQAIRGGGNVDGDSALGWGDDASGQVGFDKLPGDSPSPDDRLLRAEDLQEVYGEIQEAINDDNLFHIYKLWGSGLTKQEISHEIELSPSSVYRKLELILQRLQDAYPQSTLPDRM